MALAAALAGCGGSKPTPPPPPPKRVAGAGFTVVVPGGWRVTRAAGRLVAAPRDDGVALVGVSTYRLLKPYRPQLYAATTVELDRAAARLAAALHGRVAAARTIRVAGGRVRQYDVAYTRGDRLVQRMTFVLHGLREYQLSCTYRDGEREPLAGACGRFVAGFRLTAPPA